MRQLTTAKCRASYPNLRGSRVMGQTYTKATSSFSCSTRDFHLVSHFIQEHSAHRSYTYMLFNVAIALLFIKCGSSLLSLSPLFSSPSPLFLGLLAPYASLSLSPTLLLVYPLSQNEKGATKGVMAFFS